jgi:DNA polymerase-4
MHYILYLSLDGLYTRRIGSGESPLVIHRDRAVIDANASARQLGAFPGMALTEAKSMLSGVKFVAWNPDDDAALRDSWLEPMLEFTDRIQPAGPHEAYLDLTGHPDPLSIAEKCVERIGLPLTAGVGCAKWVAKAVTRHDNPLSQDHVVRPEVSLKGLPTRVLPIPGDAAERLVFLGYPTLGDVQKAPLDVLQKQFGNLGRRIHDGARGRISDPVQGSYPPDTIAVRVYMETPWVDEAGMEADLRTLASRMGRALVDKDKAARKLQLILVDEEGKQDERERIFSKPLRTGFQVFSAIRGIVLQEEAFPAVEARAKLTNLEKAVTRQFELAKLKTSNAGETMREALDGVRARFGSDSLKPAAEVAIPRRKAVLRAWCDATGWR